MDEINKDIILLCSEEVGKLIANLRCTDKYSDIAKPMSIWQRDPVTVTAVGIASPVPSASSSVGVGRQNSTISSTGAADQVTVDSVDQQASAPSAIVTAAQAGIPGTNTLEQLILLHRRLVFSPSNSVNAMELLAPIMSVITDPSLSGFVTAGALGSIIRFLENGFLTSSSIRGLIIECVTRTRFVETDRDHDETVLLRIVKIVDFILTGDAVDKAKVAVGLQCVQTIWIQDNHSSSLRDAARSCVFNVLKSVITSPDGFDGYAMTLLENICLNIELLARQPNATFDSDKLGFFVDVLGFIQRAPRGDGRSSSTTVVTKWIKEIVPFEINNTLFWLIPPAHVAAGIDNSGHQILLRNSSGLSIVGSLLGIGNALIWEHLMRNDPTAAVVVESMISCMYLRGLLGVSSHHALSLFYAKKSASNHPLGPGGYYKISDPHAPHNTASMMMPMTQPIQATLLEGLVQLLGDSGLLIVPILWESFDNFWHRTEICSLLIDAIVGVSLQNRVISLPKPQADSAPHLEEVRKALMAFHSLAESPDSTIDPSILVPSYIECLSMDLLRSILGGLTSVDTAADATAAREYMHTQKTRIAAKETAKLIHSKPKKAHEYIENFLSEYSVHPPNEDTNSLAWALRVIPYTDFETLGEFFGQPTEISSIALSDFIKALNLKDMDPEEALRACLQSFRLPGEAQQIDRIIKEIAYEYYASHSDLSVRGNYFASADAAYTFLFSVIMLNTDQHNPQVKKRMELKDFLRNNRKINEGEDIPEDVQTRVFTSIRNSQIVTPKSASWFCAPLKGRWKDLYYMNKTGYIPNNLVLGNSKTAPAILTAKGWDILIGASYQLARDPNKYTCAIEVISKLAGLAIRHSLTDLANESISILRRYAIKSFATNISGIIPTNRSYECLNALLGLSNGGPVTDQLLESVALMLCYWATYSIMMPPGVWEYPPSWLKILALPVLDSTGFSAGAPTSGTGSGIASIFRGLLNPMYESEMGSNSRSETPPVIAAVVDDSEDYSPNSASLSSAAIIQKRLSIDSFANLTTTIPDWRMSVMRLSFMESSPNAPSVDQLMSIRNVDIEKFIESIGKEKSSALTLLMLDMISHPTRASQDEFWQKELIRSSPWSLFLALRMMQIGGVDLVTAGPSRDALICILRNFASNNLLSDIRGLKLTVFAAFQLVTLFARADPECNIVDPGWIMPVLDELSSLAGKSNLMMGLGPIVCMSIRTMLVEAPSDWVSRLGTPVWREIFRLIASICPGAKAPGLAVIETTKKICHETGLIILLSRQFLNSFASSTNGVNDMNESLIAFEAIVGSSRTPQRVCKHLTDLACKLAGMSSYGPGVGVAWTGIVGRITIRVVSVTKQRRPTGTELSDVVELLRMCLGDPRAVQILTPAQAGSTIEKCASTLTSVVSADTPAGALQAALCVFARFFLLCLDKLQKHGQFDHLWLMSLRVILLFIKRGHDDPSMEQLAEITTETLRNALQVLVAAQILGAPGITEDTHDSSGNNPVWWKVTWDIVESFCPGMTEDLLGGPDQPSVEAAPQQESAGESENTQPEELVAPAVKSELTSPVADPNLVV